MRIDVVTIFPKMFEPVLGESIIKRARQKGRVRIFVHNLRDYTQDVHRKVDARPFGGGSGMVLKVEPIDRAVKDIRRKGKKKEKENTSVILLTPAGKRFNHARAKELGNKERLILICGRYEGVDERVTEMAADMELSIGDYVLTGGEIPAMTVIDAVTRLIPGVLGGKDSCTTESFEESLLEYPQYTRPAEYMGMKVPRVLLSGDHKKIEGWRKGKSLAKTKRNAPHLLRLKMENE